MSLISLIETIKVNGGTWELQQVTGKIHRIVNSHTLNELTVTCIGRSGDPVSVSAGRFMDFWYDGSEWKIMGEMDMYYDTLPLKNRVNDPDKVTGRDVIFFKEHRPYYRKCDEAGTVVEINNSASVEDLKDAIDKRLHSGTSANDCATAFRRQKTLNTKFGFWGEVLWASATSILIKPKSASGHKWIGCILNDGMYIESTSDITVTLDASTLDGIGAVQANSWYWLCGYEKSNGDLGFGMCLMPVAKLAESSPGNILTINQMSGKDIKSLFPAGSSLCLFESGTKFETPVFYQNGTTYIPTSYNPSKSSMTVSGHPGANQIQLSGTLLVTNFAITPDPGTRIYAVDGFQPVDCNTGSVHTNIGARGWVDSGIRIYSNASGQVKRFVIRNDKFYFTNGAGSANSTHMLGEITERIYLVGQYKMNFCPPDKEVIGSYGADITQGIWYAKYYYDAYGQAVFYGTSEASVADENYDLHGILSVASGTTGGGSPSFIQLGYRI